MQTVTSCWLRPLPGSPQLSTPWPCRPLAPSAHPLLPNGPPADVCLYPHPLLACVSSASGERLRGGGEAVGMSGFWESRRQGGALRAPDVGACLGLEGTGSEARQSPGRTGTFLSHEHSLQASSCCPPQCKPGPLSSPLLPTSLTPSGAPSPPLEVPARSVGLTHWSLSLLFFTSPHPLPNPSSQTSQ